MHTNGRGVEEGARIYMVGRGVDQLGFPDLSVEVSPSLIDCPECGSEGPHEVLQWPGQCRTLRCFECDKEW